MGICESKKNKNYNKKGNYKASNPFNEKNQGIIFVPGQWFPINFETINIGLGWDFDKNDTFDLDGSVTAFDECNEVIESIYFSHLKGLQGAIKHFGDNLTGVGEGDDEVILVNLNKIPQTVLSLAVAINSYRKNNIIKAKKAYIRLFNNQEIGRFILNKTKDCIALLLGLFKRNPQTNGWYFQVMIDPIEGHIITDSYPSLKILLKGYSESFNSNIINYKPRHPLPGEVQFIPETWHNIDCQLIYVGLGWDILPGNIYDLDASIISFDQQFNVIDIIYHKNLKSIDGSIVHYGDNKTGIGEGDDEVLSIDFTIINTNIYFLAVIVNSFKGNSMVGLRSAFIRLFDRDKPIGCHILGQGIETVGLLLGIFKRLPSQNIWNFQVMISPLNSNEAPNSIEELRVLMHNYNISS